MIKAGYEPEVLEIDLDRAIAALKQTKGVEGFKLQF